MTQDQQKFPRGSGGRRAMAAVLALDERGIRRVFRADVPALRDEFGPLSLTALYESRRVLGADRAVAMRVAAGELPLRRAVELVTKGPRCTCLACDGKGYTNRRPAPLKEGRHAR